MLQEFDYQDRCWWCDSPATTKEHKFKKTDVKRLFRSDFEGKGRPSILRGSKLFTVQGPNSDEIKYERPNLCARCNNERSQPFDRAYDSALENLLSNPAQLLEEDHIDFAKVFPQQDATRGKLMFLRYIAKHACCRFANAGIRISSPLIDFLDQKTDRLIHLCIHFCYRVDIAALQAESKESEYYTGPNLANSDLMQLFDSAGQLQASYGWLQISGLEIRYIYDDHFCDQNFPGLSEYHAYDFAVLTNTYYPPLKLDERVKDPSVRLKPFSDSEYIISVYNTDMYKWYQDKISLA